MSSVALMESNCAATATATKVRPETAASAQIRSRTDRRAVNNLSSERAAIAGDSMPDAGLQDGSEERNEDQGELIAVPMLLQSGWRTREQSLKKAIYSKMLASAYDLLSGKRTADEALINENEMEQDTPGNGATQETQRNMS